MSLLFNTLSRFVRAFLPRSKCLLILWLQSPSVVILEPKKIKIYFTYHRMNDPLKMQRLCQCLIENPPMASLDTYETHSSLFHTLWAPCHPYNSPFVLAGTFVFLHKSVTRSLQASTKQSHKSEKQNSYNMRNMKTNIIL